MSIIGGNPEELTALKTTFQREAARVEELSGIIRSHLDSVNWQGPHAEQFKSSWRDEFEPVLHRLEEALIDAGMEVGRAGERLRAAGGMHP